MELGNLKFSILIKILLKTLLLISLFNILNGCGGGGTATSNAAASLSGNSSSTALSGGPISVTYLQEAPWGVEGSGLVKAKDNQIIALILTSDVQEALASNGTISDPTGITLVSTISESIDSNGVVTGEYVIKDNDTGETGNALIRGYADALIYDVVTNSGETATMTGGSRVTYMPLGNYTYKGYAENFYQDTSGKQTSETGRFNLIANFGNNSASLSADTGILEYSDNNLVIDRTNGEFTGIGTGTFVPPRPFDPISGTYGPKITNTTIRGLFHGTTAESVSGMSKQRVLMDDGKYAYFYTLIAGER